MVLCTGTLGHSRTLNTGKWLQVGGSSQSGAVPPHLVLCSILNLQIFNPIPGLQRNATLWKCLFMLPAARLPGRPDSDGEINLLHFIVHV